ncbi:unnamed protein product [Urochloa decumbens]|uniref:Leucine-rich repeat-containing N-terminal plant-type domain-containing protein n=1 Tax=Urochloa decumbens TaxID=240449 RepID=A0ABC9BFZ1_9POAL
MFVKPTFGPALVMLISLASLAYSCTEHEKSSLLQFVTDLSHDGGLTGLWDNGTDCCKWEGITCSSGTTVTDVLLSSRSLHGHISPSLGNLTGLLRLNLSHNLLSGGLPLELVSSHSIVVLDVSFNKLNGELQELKSSAPMRPMKVLNISSNFFTGHFPYTTWEVMKSLVALNASNNSFTGQIQPTFCISSPSFAVLELSYNRFSGSIPTVLGNCSMLRVLKANHNILSGTLPDELFNATSLEYLSFSSNALQGILDAMNIAKLKNLKFLILEKITSLERFQNPYASSRDCKKYIWAIMLSKKISNLKSLSFLSLGNNSLTNLTNALQTLSGSKNLTVLLLGLSFKNEIMPDDDSIERFENLQVLLLKSNQLTGSIPNWISSLNFLFYVDISNNSLTGQIPTAITEMPMLKSENTAARLNPRVFELPIYIDSSISLLYRKPSALPNVLMLGNNDFIGVIPPDIGLLKELLSLNLSNNKLAGEIPQGISNLTNLLLLDLSGNHLTGAIPAALNDLHFLSIFNISNNDLEGPIPIGGQLSTFLNSTFNGNPKLCGPMLVHHCGSSETIFPQKVAKETELKIIFAIAFGAFFLLGVLYDQIVLSRFLG